MKTIVPNQTFKHSGKSYEKDTSYEVSDEEANYFQMVGWVGRNAVDSSDVSLEVHDGQFGHASEVK